jgi:cytosine/adenosine deaminase-related metal-dependent hydrolase
MGPLPDFVLDYVSVNTFWTILFVTFFFGAWIYTKYRMYVRIPIEQAGYWKTQGFFELKEHLASIGLGLLPIYWYLWKNARNPEYDGARKGITIGGGTDAHRVMNYNPFVSLQWMLDGKTVGGMPTRGPEETPTREEALRLYTLGSAWFSFDDEKRGSLTPGKLADLAVLTKDYLTVPVEEVGSIASLLTMVGGRVVYATGPYAALEEKGTE